MSDELMTRQQLQDDLETIYNNKIYPYLNGATHTGCVPLGTILPYFGESAPTHFLICDGTTYNVNDYPELAAHLLSLTDHSAYEVSGDNTKFKVPDLRGEFLRGAGTNGHIDQGSGSNVGVHQDATEFSARILGTNIEDYSVTGEARSILNYDTAIKTAGQKYTSSETIQSYSGENTAYRTSRPTNTSVLWCIAYRNAYIDLALNSFPIEITQPTDGQLLMFDATAGRWVNGGHKYSTDEHVVGTWIDGKPVYEKTVSFDTNVYTDSDRRRQFTVYTQSNVEKLIKVDGYYQIGQSSLLIKGTTMKSDGGIQYTLYETVDTTTNKANVGVYVQSDSGITNVKGIITIQYTKATN